MIKNLEYFTKEIEKQRKKFERFKPANIVYGSNVMPVLRMYKELSTSEERDFFIKSLDNLLADSDAEKRRFAIDICLGFFIFRNEI